MQRKAPNEIHVILKETLEEHALSYVTVKNWVALFIRGDFFPVVRLVLDEPRSNHPGDY